VPRLAGIEQDQDNKGQAFERIACLLLRTADTEEAYGEMERAGFGESHLFRGLPVFYSGRSLKPRVRLR
jgi:hypothetical protein